jgi:hypothetical protein
VKHAPVLITTCIGLYILAVAFFLDECGWLQ